MFSNPQQQEFNDSLNISFTDHQSDNDPTRDKPFHEAKCIKGEPYLDACVSIGCTKPAIICSASECQCRKQHYNQQNGSLCVKADIQKLYQNLIKIEHDSLQSAKEFRRKLGEVEDLIKIFKLRDPQLYIQANLTQAERKFRKLVRERKFRDLKGDDMARVLSEKMKRKSSLRKDVQEKVEASIDKLYDDVKSGLSKIEEICHEGPKVDQSIAAHQKIQKTALKEANSPKQNAFKYINAIKENALNRQTTARQLDSFKKQSKERKILGKQSHLNQNQGQISKILNHQEFENLKTLFHEKEGDLKDTLEIKQFHLVYRASDNKFSTKEFHKKCDSLQKTVVVIKTQFQKVIGGYNACKWSSKRFVSDKNNESFVFSLTNYEKFKIPNGNKQAKQKAIGYDPRHGPIFAGHSQNYSLKICDKANTINKSIGHPLLGYQNEEYQEKEDYSHFERFNGNRSKFFKIQEWQVFQIEFDANQRPSQETQRNSEHIQYADVIDDHDHTDDSIDSPIKQLEKFNQQSTDELVLSKSCHREDLSTSVKGLRNHENLSQQKTQNVQDQESLEDGEVPTTTERHLIPLHCLTQIIDDSI